MAMNARGEGRNYLERDGEDSPLVVAGEGLTGQVRPGVPTGVQDILLALLEVVEDLVAMVVADGERVGHLDGRDGCQGSVVQQEEENEWP